MPNVVEEVVDTSQKVFSTLDRIKSSNDMLKEVFSYLAGCEIVHKIGVINKRFRKVA